MHEMDDLIQQSYDLFFNYTISSPLRSCFSPYFS